MLVYKETRERGICDIMERCYKCRELTIFSSQDWTMIDIHCKLGQSIIKPDCRYYKEFI